MRAVLYIYFQCTYFISIFNVRINSGECLSTPRPVCARMQSPSAPVVAVLRPDSSPRPPPPHALYYRIGARRLDGVMHIPAGSRSLCSLARGYALPACQNCPDSVHVRRANARWRLRACIRIAPRRRARGAPRRSALRAVLRLSVWRVPAGEGYAGAIAHPGIASCCVAKQHAISIGSAAGPRTVDDIIRGSRTTDGACARFAGNTSVGLWIAPSQAGPRPYPMT